MQRLLNEINAMDQGDPSEAVNNNEDEVERSDDRENPIQQIDKGDLSVLGRI